MEQIAEAIIKRDGLYVGREVYQNFMSLLSMNCGHSETLKNFDSHFVARVSKFNSDSDSTRLPEVLTAFILLANSAVDNCESIFVLAAASNESSLQSSVTTDEYFATVSYETVASVLRQSDQMKYDAPSFFNVQ